MEGRVLRRSVTLADQLAAVGCPAPSVAVGAGPGAAAGSCNLRDLLKLRDEDDLASAGRRAAVTLASAMAAERQVSLPAPSPSPSPSPSSSSPATVAAAAAAARTLLDIIRDDQPPTASVPAAGDGIGDPFVRRAVSLPPPTTATASPPAPLPTSASAAPAPPPLPPASATAADEAEREQEQRVSLMALLEQTDRQWSAVPGATTHPEDEDDDPAALEALDPAAVDDDADLEPDAAAAAAAGGRGCCCVCMARAKGAAFIPCGHTFCRFCARELLAGRGRCPLCNAAIVDVLDIF